MGCSHASWILALEPDAGRAANLTALVREWVDCGTIVVPTAEAAVAAMADAVPDLILLSTLTAPGDEARLSAYLRSLPHACDITTLTVPPVVEAAPAPSSVRRGLLTFRRRQAAPLPLFDRDALGRRVRDAFEASRAAQPRRVAAVAAARPPLFAPRSDVRPAAPPMLSDAALAAHCGLGPKVLRDHRWPGQDLPVFTVVRLPWGLDAQIVNISRSGLLLESGARLSVGELQSFEIRGTQPVLVTGRIVRSHVAGVDRAARYQTAVHFQAPIELPDGSVVRPGRLVTTHLPELDGLLDYVRREAERGADPGLIRAAFELGVQGLVTARDVRLVPASTPRVDEGHTVCLSVPALGGADTVLQVVFDDDHAAPSDLGVLEAAAARAAEVLDVEAAFRRPLMAM
jgi:hypothetical protein